MQIHPIGTFFGDAVYKYDAPRQGRLFAGHLGRIVLNPGMNFETALRDLDGFERLWVIFLFHENAGWRPTTRPPVPPKGRDRVGTFASRSPYRPNPIGLSCVRLLKIEGLTLYVDEADLLNETPVLDIKPYIPYADAFPEARAGFAPAAPAPVLEVAEGPHWRSPFDERDTATLKEILSLDPRPAFHNDPDRVYGLPFGGYDVRFRVEGERLILLEAVRA